ncbi:MAG: hypothetical protein J6Z79_00340 [Clostridia bacterium]|nr:hypothetical protein [Clostridia bacterium]
MKKKKPGKWEEEGLDGYDWYEGQPKWPLRRIIGVAAVGISVFIYVFLFFRFCTAFSGGFGDTVYLTGKSTSVYPAQETSIRRFYPETRADDDGSVQLIFTAALEKTDSFQCTVKINRNARAPGKEDCGYKIALRWDRDGETHLIPLADFQMKDVFQYRHLACLFEDVPDAEKATLTFLICPADAKDISFETAFYTATVGGESVYSAVVRPKSDRFVVKGD